MKTLVKATMLSALLFAAFFFLPSCSKNSDDQPEPETILTKEILHGAWNVMKEEISSCDKAENNVQESRDPDCSVSDCFQFIFKSDGTVDVIYRVGVLNYSESTMRWDLLDEETLEFCFFFECDPVKGYLEEDGQLTLVFSPGHDIISFDKPYDDACVRTLTLVGE